jgi:hypothetical protein
MTMLHGAFVLKMKTPKWRLCVVKQVPDQRESSWMLFGQHKSNKSKFQMEFGSHQETILVKHLLKMASSVDDNFYAELHLVLVAESPAISCIESLWSLKGIEMYHNRFHTPNYLHDALHQDVYMLSLSPQMQDPKIAQPQQISQPQQPQPHHPMQTRSRKH